MTSHVAIAGTDIDFPCAPDERILDAAERAGYSMPYSCRKGVCESCQAMLTSGAVKIAPFGSPRSAGEKILCCMAIADGPVEIAPPWIEQRRAPTRARISVVVHSVIQRSPDVVALHLRLPIGLRVPFRAGQYVTVIFEDGETRNYSIANAPHLNDVVDLHVRRIAGGRFSDRLLNGLQRGSVIEVELPFGLFALSDQNLRPALMLATGTGFAPLKSMIEDQIWRDAERPIHLFWGGERKDDIYELELVESWAKTLKWFRFTPVLANPDAEWAGARGYVQDAVVACYEDLSGHEVYACGNPFMIDQARALLVGQARLAPEDFHADAFVFSGNASEKSLTDEASRLESDVIDPQVHRA